MSEDQNMFGEYAPEPSTQPPNPDGAESSEMQPDPLAGGTQDAEHSIPEKYGIGKPRRIIVRGKVAADTDTEPTPK